MPAVTQKIVKRRIKSIANTMKITKAMELVSAAKMRKAVQGALSTRPFATLSWATITALSQVVGGAKHPLLEENVNATKKLLVVFTADRGLAGGFNANIIKAVLKFAGAVGADPGIGPQVDLFTAATEPAEINSKKAHTMTFDNTSDAPACDSCGSIMVRNAACYKCLNCGSTSGCS